MAMSGVELTAECKTVYDEVQSKKKHRYVTFMIADGKIKVDKVILKNLSFDKIVIFPNYLSFYFRSVIEKAPMINFWPICVSRMVMRMTAVTPFTIMSTLCTLKEQKHPTGPDYSWSAGVPTPPASRRR